MDIYFQEYWFLWAKSCITFKSQQSQPRLAMLNLDNERLKFLFSLFVILLNVSAKLKAKVQVSMWLQSPPHQHVGVL
jgi:hypothetical protein